MTCQAQLTARMARAAVATAASASHDQHGEKRDVWLLLCQVRATLCNLECGMLRLEGLKFERRSRTEMSFYDILCLLFSIMFSQWSLFLVIHPIGKQMKIEYLRLGLGSTCLGVASLQKLALPSSLALSSGGAKRYQLHSIANGRLHASCKLNL